MITCFIMRTRWEHERDVILYEKKYEKLKRKLEYIRRMGNNAHGQINRITNRIMSILMKKKTTNLK